MKAFKEQQHSTSEDDLFQQIRDFQVFKEDPDEFIRQFARIARRWAAMPDGTIISQGQDNDRLLILLSGRVEVIVDDERIATLETPGDLMGEISVFGKRPASATLKASNFVEYLEIDLSDLEVEIGDTKTNFGYYLFRALSKVLSEKLIRTNEKARKFEINSREIVRLTTAVSSRKVEELYSNRSATLKRITDLEDRYLTPMLKTVQEIESRGPSNAELVSKLKNQLNGSLQVLRPISEFYSAEQALRSCSVLLMEGDRNQHLITRLALGGSGVDLHIAATPEDISAQLDLDLPYNLIFISPEWADWIPQIKKVKPEALIVFMMSSDVPSSLPTLRKHQNQITSVISRNREDRAFTIKHVSTTVSKLMSKDLFGMDKYLNWSAEVQKKVVKASTQREELIDEMKIHFRQLGLRNTVLERLGVMAEEMLMNAIYDAPRGPEGKSRYNHLPRTTNINLEEAEFAEFQYACDGLFAGVSVSDPFGGFRMHTLLEYLERNYNLDDGKTAEAIEGKGGAGRGLHQMVENSDLIVFNVQNHIRTEVIGLVNLDGGVSKKTNPSFHFFTD